MNHTKVFATKDELNDLINLAQRGWTNGEIMIASSVMEGIRKDNATIDAKIACHKLALAHGLPEIEGYYGINKEGEFLTC